MRTFSTLQEKVIPFLGPTLPKLTEKLQIVAKNPSKPHFNHYLFETLSFSIRIVCSATPSAVTSFEDVLFPIFQGILSQDIQEFVPYVFQLLSLLLELTAAGAIPDAYIQLLPCLLAPVLWERPANIGPLVRLLCAYTTQAAPQIVAQDKLVSCGVCPVARRFIGWFVAERVPGGVSEADCVQVERPRGVSVDAEYCSACANVSFQNGN